MNQPLSSTSEAVVLFASAAPEAVDEWLQTLKTRYPQAALFVVAELPTDAGRWIRYYPRRSWRDNFMSLRAALRGVCVREAVLLLDPLRPYWKMRAMAAALKPKLCLSPTPHELITLAQLPGFVLGRQKEWLRRQVRPTGAWYVFAWRLGNPSHFRRPVFYQGARAVGAMLAELKAWLPARRDRDPGPALPKGVSVVIPSRSGAELLARLLPGVEAELQGFAHEVIVVDNGSDDGSVEWLQRNHPAVVTEVSDAPLSFAAAVNRGIRRAQFSHVCLLNNDMVVQPGFFREGLQAFTEVPELFCATAQIFFPPGVRREETGKAVMPPRAAGSRDTSFPVRCDMPIATENLSYVLYGSGGASFYDTRKLRQIGCFGEMFKPAYVEDLDVGFRAWQRGWPTVYVERAGVIHYHRTTTSKYYTPEALELVLDVNYLRFLARAVSEPAVFRHLWNNYIWAVNLKAAQHFPVFHAIAALAFAWRAPRWLERPPRRAMREWEILAVGSGDVAVFPGRPGRSGKSVVLIATPYLPYPLSHGGAVRMYNLMRRAAVEFDQVLVAFCDELAAPPPELLEIFREVVLVRRERSHLLPSTKRPDMVEEFDQPAFHGALRLTCRKHQPAVVQLEFTHMAQYGVECNESRRVLVEHDITFDLHEQFLRRQDDWEMRRQYTRWRSFEKHAWRQFDAVVTMSERDAAQVKGARAAVIANGVDLERFQPAADEPEAGRILFIGAFQHLPNLVALQYFLEEIWPRLRDAGAALHVIAGANHELHLAHFRGREALSLEQPGIEVEGLVMDVRPAYRRASVVIAPLLASAGTNIKILEAMAMGKAIVSTPAGVNGLDLAAGSDFLLGANAAEFAANVRLLLSDGERRRAMERQARQTAEARYDWNAIAEQQAALYRELTDNAKS